MTKIKIAAEPRKINIKYSDGGYEALQGGDSEAMLSHLTGGTWFDECDLEQYSKEAAVHGWKLVVR